jgi:hypothetical protein
LPQLKNGIWALFLSNLVTMVLRTNSSSSALHLMKQSYAKRVTFIWLLASSDPDLLLNLQKGITVDTN